MEQRFPDAVRQPRDSQTWPPRPRLRGTASPKTRRPGRRPRPGLGERAAPAAATALRSLGARAPRYGRHRELRARRAPRARAQRRPGPASIGATAPTGSARPPAFPDKPRGRRDPTTAPGRAWGGRLLTGPELLARPRPFPCKRRYLQNRRFSFPSIRWFVRRAGPGKLRGPEGGAPVLLSPRAAVCEGLASACGGEPASLRSSELPFP